MNIKNIIFLSIILIASVLRLSFLGSIAPSLTWDEVAWGYNAYSLGIDAKDEFGKFLPLTYLESFGDFKPPLYAYLDILPVKLIGLNEFSTRLPSALFGIFSVAVTYLFVLEIFGKDRKNLALLSAFMLAISPWHIMLSRAAFEANVAQFFVISGIYLFFLSLRKNPYFLMLSMLSFVLSMYTFNSARIVVPIVVLILFVVYRKKLLNFRKAVILSFVLGIITFIPLFIFLNTPQAKLRFNEVNIFSDSAIINTANQQIENDGNTFVSKIIHNRRLAYGVEYLHHYFDNLTPKFLFVMGDGNPKFSIQDVGQLYLWEFPFLVAGIIYLFRKREGKWWIIPVILLVGIIPAGFARETPHALRIENSLPAFQILTALGLISIHSQIYKKWRFISLGIISLIVIVNLAYFLHNYMTHYPREFSGEWQYGYKESINYVSKVRQNYEKVYVTEELGRPYVYYLFYLKTDPREFRSEAEVYREALGFVHVTKFKNLHFVDNIASLQDKNALYIATPSEKPQNANVIQEFRLLNGNTALVAYTL